MNKPTSTSVLEAPVTRLKRTPVRAVLREIENTALVQALGSTRHAKSMDAGTYQLRALVAYREHLDRVIASLEK